MTQIYVHKLDVSEAYGSAFVSFTVARGMENFRTGEYLKADGKTLDVEDGNVETWDAFDAEEREEIVRQAEAALKARKGDYVVVMTRFFYANNGGDQRSIARHWDDKPARFDTRAEAMAFIAIHDRNTGNLAYGEYARPSYDVGAVNRLSHYLTVDLNGY